MLYKFENVTLLFSDSLITINNYLFLFNLCRILKEV